MPTYSHIESYYAKLEELIQFGGSDNELSIRRAFENCLDAYCQDRREKLVLVSERRAKGNVIPDGTVVDSLRMARGYWEAKDSHDDLDAEIRNKFDRGYPRDNIVFEDSQMAVLVQNGDEALRVDMSRPGELHRLIRRFLDYELPNIEEFRKAQEQFKSDLPTVLVNLRQAVAAAEEGNEDYRSKALEFLTLCRRSIGPDVSEADVREMLLQHILTKDIFLRVFAEDQFHRENNVAHQLDELEGAFFTGNFRREAIDRLRAYYGAIGRAANEIADYDEKQQFLKAIYEDFYRAYNPAAADRLGVVYTPNEVVDFMVRGADYLLQKHFGKTLADENVQILDPATGTGTFITNLINYLPVDRLEHKYRHEIHANEVAILPYYIANLNIEYTYRERTGEYLEFRNLCFVDTLDNMDWQQRGATAGTVTRQGAFNLGSLSEENWIRVQEQNEKPISVIIGNPPYNDGASSWGDGSANRTYPQIEARMKETYGLRSVATKQHDDICKYFVRWASDRLADDGIIGFITNRTYIDGKSFDGFRKVLAEEFSELWIVDLKGNANTSGERRKREGGNIFNNKIKVGVAIYFLVRRRNSEGFSIFYNAVDDFAKAPDKVAYIEGKILDSFDFVQITPDAHGNWLNQSSPDFERLLPLANRQTKFANKHADEIAVFGLYTNAVKSNRDEWVYDFDVSNLRAKALFFADTYNALLDACDDSFDPVIKWSRDIRNQFQRGRRVVYNDACRIQSLYRPFVNRQHFADFTMNDVLTRNHYQMFGPDLRQPNKVINFCTNGKDFYVLAADKPTDFHFTGDTQCLPLYRYNEEGELVSNITNWGIQQINDHYRQEWGDDFEELAGPQGITAEDIFAYIYAVLHDPVYRHDYRVDLLREIPRLPLYHQFYHWRDMGRELLDLHIGFEEVEPYWLERVDAKDDGRRALLSAHKESGTIVLDDETTLRGVPPEAWEYQLGSRSALEWVLDLFTEPNPKSLHPTIAEKFNTYRFADYKEQVIDLLQRVCTVSVETVEIVRNMAYWNEEGNLVVYGDRDKHEWATMGLAQWFSEPEDEEWLAAWSET